MLSYCLDAFVIDKEKKMFYKISRQLQTFHFRQKKIRGEENFVLIFAFSSLAC